MNAVTKREEPTGAVTEISGGLVAVIERALADPNTGVEALERLLAMQERIHERSANIAYTEALATMQPLLPIITERGKIILREKDKEGRRTGDIIQETSYAYWEDINEAIRPLLQDHGFALTFDTGLSDDGRVKVVAILKHRMGHQETASMILPHDSTGSKNAVQAIGSSTSYGKRYATMALLNITTRGEDDDGVSALPEQVHRQSPDAPAKDAKKPLPAGKHTSRTSLQNAIRKLKSDGEKLTNPTAFEALITQYQPDLLQLKNDLHPWWTATEYESVPAWLERRRAQLSGGHASLTDKLNACETKLQLAAFLDANLDDIDAMDGEDRRRFDEEYEAREAAINLMDRSVS